MSTLSSKTENLLQTTQVTIKDNESVKKEIKEMSDKVESPLLCT